MSNHSWTIPINYILLPLIFFSIAVSIIVATEALEKKLPKHSRFKKWLQTSSPWKNPNWLSERIDMLFVIFIVIALVVVTVLYS